MHAYVALILAALPNTAKALRAAQKMGAAVRRHLKVQDAILSIALREALSQNPAMRARVQRDLGGRGAMVKWALRWRGQRAVDSSRQQAAKRGETAMAQRFALPAREPRTSPRKPWTAKTDRHGHFRLAVIPTGPRGASRGRAMTTSSTKPKRIKTRRAVTRRFKPLEVTCDDLGFNAGFTSHHWDAPKTVPLQTGHPPPIDRPPI